MRNAVDASIGECQFGRVKAKKSAKSSPRKTELLTQGTGWAAELRAQCNKLTDAQREEALAHAMRLIYADESKPAHSRRR